MTIQINGTTGISGVDGSATTPALQGQDANTGISFGTDEVNIVTGGSTRATVDANGDFSVNTDAIFVDASADRVGIGTTSAAGNAGTRLVLHDSSSPRLRLTNSTTGETASDGGEISLDGSNLHIENRESAAIRFYNGGSERAQLDSSGNLKFNSGYGSVATAYGVRAWVNFVGTGTVTKRQHGNITSVTDNATGDYTLSFTTALVDADYSVVASCGTSANGNPPGIVSLFRVNSTGNWVSPTTSAFRITTSSTGGIPQDGAWVCVAVIR